MALTATRLEGVEDEVLERAEGYLRHDTPLLKYVLPGVHRRYVEYFAERLYPPSIAYMERLLRAESYDATQDSLKADFSVTRSTVYRALDRFPSELVADVFIRQLALVATTCSPDLVTYELHAFGDFAVRHATTADRRWRVAGSLGALLGHDLEQAEETAPIRPNVDYGTHKKIVELLAELGTPEAAAILNRELQNLTELDDGSTEAKIVQTLHALARLPESAELDVPHFLQAAAGLSDPDRLLHVPLVLEAHPDPAAHAFHLEQARWIADHWEELEAWHTVDPERTLWNVIERLKVFDEPAQLARTRAELDRLFISGEFDEVLFVSISESINELDGGQSAEYRKLMERRRLEREAEARQKIAEARRESLRIVDDNTTPEGIRKNLDRLGGPGSGHREAAAWLVIAGPDAVPMAHERLADPATSPEAAFRLLQVLGEIGDPRSVGPTIEFLRGDTGNRALFRAGFRALSQMPTSEETFDFASGVLADEHSTAERQAALVYLASVREVRAAATARAYSAAEVEPELRVAGLLLAARLGLEEAEPAIVEALEATEDRSNGEVLLRALGELTTPDELRALAGRFPVHWARPYLDDVLTLMEFRRAEGAHRVELARKLIEAGHPWDRREAVHSLVEDGPHDVLVGYLQLHPAMGLPLERSVVHSPAGVPILAQIRRMGYVIVETPVGFELIRDETRR
jgi:hypothetical protein